MLFGGPVRPLHGGYPDNARWHSGLPVSAFAAAESSGEEADWGGGPPTVTSTSQAQSDAPVDEGQAKGSEQNTISPSAEGSVSPPAASQWRDKREGRVIHQEFTKRDDIGCCSVYQSNWGGKRSALLMNLHIAYDIIGENPANVLTAQEVDEEFIELMQDPSRFDEGVWKRLEVRHKAESVRNAAPWVVSTGVENPKPGSRPAGTVIVAARSTLCRSIDRLEWVKFFDGTYKDGKKSRVRR